ncbi:hypothetical protein GSY74_09790 [Sulfurovum sp. bin170]|nr:hypothetical protein [Sulfurovum sp. bin170]
MLKKEELYTEEINEATTNNIYSEENRVKVLLIFTLFFMILTIGYLIYNSAKDNGSVIKGTRVLGVSYIVEEKVKQKESNKEPMVEYNTKSDISNIDDNGEYDGVVMVDDRGDYRDATVVDEKEEEYTKIVTVKNPI